MSISTHVIAWMGHPTGGGGTWLLITGFWDDTGVWDDSNNWID